MCESFKALSPDEKYKVIVEKSLCENCLLSNHTVDTCFQSSRCGIDNCTEKHSRFIHSYKVQKPDVNQASVANACTNIQNQVCIPTVQVAVNNLVNTSALLDTGSTSIFARNCWPIT